MTEGKKVLKKRLLNILTHVLQNTVTNGWVFSFSENVSVSILVLGSVYLQYTQL